MSEFLHVEKPFLDQLAALGRQLAQVFGRGPSGKALRHMIRFAETPPDFRIVSALSRKLDS